ncbi:MAG: CDP-diacylglycerol--glycerol-3-phosphate 3-phosphatidyltransferase [Clostridiales bacterium]|nr:CDP-diacylglycerol--glycerol-3-phosphate 3-phosphatidyltransferase [Clostridiales bacterium]
MNLPNKLTILRLILIPVFVAIYYITVIPFNFVISAGIFVIAALTDFLDGYIARKYNLVTNLGKFLDPIADKILVSTALILLLVPLKALALPWWVGILVAVILARELLISGFRLVAVDKGIVIAADKIGKVKTFIQDVATVVLIVSFDFDFVLFNLPIIKVIGLALLILATILTIVSGISYLIKNKEVLKG